MQDLDISALIDAALFEDAAHHDITSQLLIPADKQGEIRFVARQKLVACGTFVPGEVYAKLDTGVKCMAKAAEGAHLNAGDVLAVARGPAQALLTGERVVLNIMQRMSGVATLTAAYVEAIAGTKAKILDTRKTMPGMRTADKYAVRVGGGVNHRMGLADMVLVKDNHIALAGGIEAAIAMAHSKLSVIPAKAGIQTGSKRDSSFRWNDGNKNDVSVVIECDTLAQVREALAAKPQRILLDNMTNEQLREAVALTAGKVGLEASGNVSLATVRGIAETGVDYISVGKITHSAPAVDIGADVAL